MFVVASLHGDPRDVLLAQNGRCDGACASKGGALCNECFHVDPNAPEPARVAACVDFTEKRRPPVLHEIESLTPRNVRRICIVREDEIKPGDREASREAAGMLAVSDAERLMGFPEGWTEPCARASRPNTPEHDEKSEKKPISLIRLKTKIHQTLCQQETSLFALES